MEEDKSTVQEELPPKKHYGDQKFMYFCAIAGNMAMFSSGTVFSWSSPSLPKLNGQVEPEDNPLPSPATSTEESLIASLLAIGAIIGPFLGGISADRLGRKITLIGSVVPIFACYVITAIANRVWHFYLARLLAGIGAGGIFLILPNYLAEIADKHNRGYVGCLMLVCATIGNLVVYSIGPYLSIKIMSLLLLLPPTLFFLGFAIFAPESPYILLAHNKEAEAKSVLARLRRKPAKDVEDELLEFKVSIQESYADKVKIVGFFTNKLLKRRIIISFGLVAFQQLSGINAVQFYMQNIFEASETGLQPQISVVIIGIAQFICAIVTPFVIETLGRKMLLLISSIGSMLSLIALGAFFYVKNAGLDYSHITWMPVTSLIVFVFTFNFGLGSMPFIILGEIFPPNVKAAASTSTVAICFLFAFGTTVLFPSLMENFGAWQTFWSLAVCCLAAFAFTYFFVPETKGKSLVEIQKMMDGL